MKFSHHYELDPYGIFLYWSNLPKSVNKVTLIQKKKKKNLFASDGRSWRVQKKKNSNYLVMRTILLFTLQNTIHSTEYKCMTSSSVFSPKANFGRVVKTTNWNNMKGYKDQRNNVKTYTTAWKEIFNYSHHRLKYNSHVK